MPPINRSYRWIGAAVGLALSPSLAAAEVELPRQSPTATVSQQVGLTDISVEYTSPAVKGRKIWGSVVPYDKPWSISPNQPAKIRFSKEVELGDKRVPAGTYLLSAIPSKGDWTVVLTEGKTEGKTEGDLVRMKVRAKTAPRRERLTFLFSDFSDERASLDLEWDTLRVSIPIGVNTSKQVQNGISELDTAWRSYANAARYMLETKKDFDTGLKYADQSLALKEDWYTFWIKASLLAAKGDYRGAHEQGEKAFELGLKLGDAFVLEGELRRDLADWSRRSKTDGKLSSAR